MMTIGFMILVLLIVGVVLALFPVDPTIKRVIIAIVVIVALAWLLVGLGVLPAVRFR